MKRYAYRFNPSFSTAYLAAMATLLKWQNPILASRSAWWPGGLGMEEDFPLININEQFYHIIIYLTNAKPFLTCVCVCVCVCVYVSGRGVRIVVVFWNMT